MVKRVTKYLLTMVFLSVLAAFLAVAGGNAATHSAKSRIQVSGERDDNIGEDYSNPLAGNAVRFFSTIQGRGQLSSSVPYDYDMALGYRAYPSYTRENKLALQTRSNLSRGFSGALYLGVSGNVFIENYQSGIRDSRSIFSTFYVTFPENLLKIFSFSLQLQPAVVRYPNDSFFNFTDKGWGFDIKRKVSKRLLVLGGYSYRPRLYERKALTNAQLMRSYSQQKDVINEYSAGFQYYRKILLSGWLVFRNANSNSFGFSNGESRLIVIAGCPFVFQSMIKMYLTAETKRYDDNLTIPIVTDINEDKEEDNRFIIELSRDILPNTSLEVRFEWFRNESRIRNLYYSKHVFSSGLEYTF